jgi:hypothetical protein
MAEVHDIADHRPHLLVHASDGAHVIPVALLTDVAEGRKPSQILTEPVIQRIIQEWLKGAGA